MRAKKPRGKPQTVWRTARPFCWLFHYRQEYEKTVANGNGQWMDAIPGWGTPLAWQALFASGTSLCYTNRAAGTLTSEAGCRTVSFSLMYKHVDWRKLTSAHLLLDWDLSEKQTSSAQVTARRSMVAFIKLAFLVSRRWNRLLEWLIRLTVWWWNRLCKQIWVFVDRWVNNERRLCSCWRKRDDGELILIFKNSHV